MIYNFPDQKIGGIAASQLTGDFGRTEPFIDLEGENIGFSTSCGTPAIWCIAYHAKIDGSNIKEIAEVGGKVTSTSGDLNVVRLSRISIPHKGTIYVWMSTRLTSDTRILREGVFLFDPATQVFSGVKLSTLRENIMENMVAIDPKDGTVFYSIFSSTGDGLSRLYRDTQLVMEQFAGSSALTGVYEPYLADPSTGKMYATPITSPLFLDVRDVTEGGRGVIYKSGTLPLNALGGGRVVSNSGVQFLTFNRSFGVPPYTAADGVAILTHGGPMALLEKGTAIVGKPAEGFHYALVPGKVSVVVSPTRSPCSVADCRGS